MTTINIIAKNNCTLNVNVVGNYNVALTGITGPFNVVLLKGGEDYIKMQTHWYKRYLPKEKRLIYWQNKVKEYEKDEEKYEAELKQAKENVAVLNNRDGSIQDYKTPSTQEGFIREWEKGEDLTKSETYMTKQEWKCYIKNDVITACDSSTVIQLINEVFINCLNLHGDWGNFIDYAGGYSKFKFTHIHILEASNGFKRLLGLNDIKPVKDGTQLNDNVVKYSDKIPVYNGTPYLFLRCNKLKSALRYCWQTDPNLPKDANERRRAMFANTQSIVSISPNNNMVTQPFNLTGGQFQANGNDLTDIEFTITGLDGKELEFASDLLWMFELTPLPEEDLSNIPGLFPQDEQPQQEQQEGEQGEMEQQQQMEQQQDNQQPNEQQEAQQQDETQQIEQQQEQQIILPEENGLMRCGFPRVQLIE